MAQSSTVPTKIPDDYQNDAELASSYQSIQQTGDSGSEISTNTIETGRSEYQTKYLLYQGNQSTPYVNNFDSLQPDRPVMESTPAVSSSEPSSIASTSHEVGPTQSEEHNINELVTMSSTWSLRTAGYRAGWATPSDWASHRSLITALYIDQNRTLKDIMRIMEEKHNFFATLRMYKARFKQWSIDKKIKADDAVEVFRQQTARMNAGKPSAIYIRGRKIDPVRSQRYKYRAASIVLEQIQQLDEHRAIPLPLLCKSELSYSNEIASVPQRLTDPIDTMAFRESMQILGNYVADFLEARNQRVTSDAVLSSIFTWDHYLTISQAFIGRNRVREGFTILELCFSKYKTYLQQPDWFFWPVTYKVIAQLAYIHDDLANMFLVYASELTSILLPPQHPFNQLWSRIKIIGLSGLCQHGEVLLESYLHTWEHYATSARLDTAAVVRIALFFIQLHCSGRITYAFVRDALTTILERLLPPGRTVDYLRNETNYRMACLLISKRKFNQAEDHLKEIMAWLDLQKGQEYVYLRAKCLWSMFNIKDKTKQHYEAARKGYEVLGLYQGIYGKPSLETLDITSILEDFMRRTGEVMEAEDLTKLFDEGLAEFYKQEKVDGPFRNTIPWAQRHIEVEERQEYIQQIIDLLNSQQGDYYGLPQPMRLAKG
ncbi:hypothetical protein F5B22DRAFT_39414 [Xylaria bambusicola]|uniref:uncharacterized protein n=1 Tax=Xylaria bambusicola TaxID=326684 RepID=UPI0020075A94|nr:uncharacterized protein F5B22DRAFT_39414 [Xylaria bambusicola]KAI0521125.1 hypothetical protein F5B22DRAFT_39414 [Xylaria bambusicola]